MSAVLQHKVALVSSGFGSQHHLEARLTRRDGLVSTPAATQVNVSWA